MHRSWGAAEGVSPSAGSGRGCPGDEGTTPRTVHASKTTHRLMGANLTKQSRVSRVTLRLVYFLGYHYSKILKKKYLIFMNLPLLKLS